MPSPMRSIGHVLAIVKAEFPDSSISKIWFLESEGLLSPERAPSGYRRYSDRDIERLTYILRVQRDQYLPLKVIREHLDVIDSGGEPPSLDAQPVPTVTASPEAVPATDSAGPDPRRSTRRPLRMSRRELLNASGLSEAVLVELERQQLVFPRRGTSWYGREALTICVVARKLQPYGMDSRHLRVIKQQAEREAGLVEQAIAPHLRRRGGAAEAAAEVTALVLHAHAAMMHTLIER